MNTVQKMEDWADHHHPKWIDYLRILLGVILIVKGIVYVVNKDEVMLMFETSKIWVVHYVVSHYVIGGFLACGAAIAIGLLTRPAAAFEIPALLGSIIFIDFHRGLFALNSAAVYSIIILALLLFFMLYGGGTLSIDYYLTKHKDKNYDIV